MKKFKLFLASSFVLGTLSACSNEQTTMAPLVTAPQQVNTLSEKGLVDANRAVGKIFFEKLDSNKDGNVNLVEYKRMQLSDVDARFKKVDKNKDGNISMEEMMANRKNFLPEIYNKDTLRAMAKASFDTLNTDKDSVLKASEFIQMGGAKTVTGPGEEPKPVVLSPEATELYTTIFNTIDLNHDNNLTIGEFEDFIFAQIKTKADIYNPLNEQPASPAPVPATPAQ